MDRITSIIIGGALGLIASMASAGDFGKVQENATTPISGLRQADTAARQSSVRPADCEKAHAQKNCNSSYACLANSTANRRSDFLPAWITACGYFFPTI